MIWEAAAATAFFVLVAIAITWPLVTSFQTRMLGPGGGDQLGYLFDFQYAAKHGIPILRDYLQGDVYAPFGRPSSAAANLTLLATLLPAALITKVAGPIVAYNTLTIAGLALSGLAMYWLVRWLGLGLGPAAWAGLVYVLFPYHLHAASSYVTLVPYWAFPLLVMALVSWSLRPGWRSGAAVVATAALASVTFIYFGVMAGVIVVTGLVVAALLHRREMGLRQSLVRLAAIVGALVGLVVVPLATVQFINRNGASGITRSVAEARDLSARLSDYVLPQRKDTLMTWLTGPDWYAHGSVGGERLAFLGWTTILLAVLGVILGFRARGRLPSRARTALFIGVPAGVALVLCSLRNPYILGSVEIPTPSGLLFELFPFLRAFGRFAIAVMAIAAILGAIGLARLMAGRSRPFAVAIAVAAIALSAVELADDTPLASARPSAIQGRLAEDQPTWRWLKAHSDGAAVYEYPDFGNSAIERYYMHGLFQHGHPVVNAVGNPGDIGGEFLREILLLEARPTPELLASTGVGYVALNRWAFEALNLHQPSRVFRGFEEEARFDDGSAIWRVTAPPSDGVVVFRTGFDAQRVARGRNWRWLIGRGSITAHVGAPGEYRARFRASSSRGRYVLRVSSSDGVQDSAVVDGTRDVALKLRVANGSEVIVTSDPPPSSHAPGVEMTPWLLERIT